MKPIIFKNKHSGKFECFGLGYRGIGTCYQSAYVAWFKDMHYAGA